MLPELWGPYAWHLFHTVAYNAQPNSRRTPYIQFFQTYETIMPCPQCRYHFTDWLELNPIQDVKTYSKWDTAGQEKFRAVTGGYYRGSIGVFIVYDITNRESFNNVKMWYERFIDRISEQSYAQFTIIGNKSDKDLLRDITYEEGKELAQKLNATFFETSCKKMENIEEVIKDMTDRVYSIVINNYNKNIEGIRCSTRRYYQGKDITHLNNEQISLLGTSDFHLNNKKCCN